MSFCNKRGSARKVYMHCFGLLTTNEPWFYSQKKEIVDHIPSSLINVRLPVLNPQIPNPHSSLLILREVRPRHIWEITAQVKHSYTFITISQLPPCGTNHIKFIRSKYRPSVQELRQMAWPNLRCSRIYQGRVNTGRNTSEFCAFLCRKGGFGKELMMMQHWLMLPELRVLIRKLQTAARFVSSALYDACIIVDGCSLRAYDTCIYLIYFIKYILNNLR